MSKRHSPIMRHALRALLATIAITVLVAVLGMVAGVNEQLLASCLVVGLACIAAMLAGWAWERGRWRPLLKVACTVGVIDVAGVLVIIWAVPPWASPSGELLGRTIFGVTALVGWAVLSAVAINVRFRVWWWYTAPWVGVVMLGLAAGFFVFAMWLPSAARALDRQFGDDAMVGMVGGVVAVAAAALVALPVLSRLDRLPADDLDAALASPHVPVKVWCPRCATLTELAANLAGRCPACALQLRMEVEEPRCGCGYLLHRLNSPTCPECGAVVPKELMWSAALTASAAAPVPSARQA